MHQVTVEVAGARARISGPGVELEYAIGEMRVQPRVGKTPRRVVLPEGGLLLTQDPVVDVALEAPVAVGFAHRLESNLKVVFVALVGLVLAGWFGYRDGIPWAAREMAMRIPPAVENDIAVQGLRELDRFVFKPSALGVERQAQIRNAFTELAVGGQVPARLEFRDGGFIGANAFAMPGGLVVMTDQLEKAIKDDGQIAAVLAHEIGHLEHRHGMRHVLQNSITGLLSAAVLGDVASIASLAATVPALVLHTSNSRAFEREADAFAHSALKKTGRSPRLLGQALTALERTRDSRGNDEGCKVPLEDQDNKAEAKAGAPETKADTPEMKAEKPAPPATRRRFEMGYLSTHPSTPERVQAAEDASR